MISFAENTALAGQRFRVREAGPGDDLGFGTYLWDGVILLDAGRKVRAKDCVVIAAARAPRKPIEVRLGKPTRTFEDAGFSLTPSRHWIHADEVITIVDVAVKPWNHGGYVAGRVRHKDKDLWLLLYEVELEPASPVLAH